MKWKLPIVASCLLIASFADAEIPKDKLDRLVADLVSTITVCPQSRGCVPVETAGDRAVKALGKIGSPAVPQLIRALSSEIPIARIRAARALALIRDPRAVKPLIELAQTSDDWQRRCAIDAIGSIPDPSGAAFLDQLVESRDRLWAWALSAVAERKDPKLMPLLMACIRDGSDSLSQYMAQSALADLGSAAVPTVVRALSDSNANRVGLLKALSLIPDRASVDAIRKACADPDLHNAAMKALVENHASETADLRTALADPHWGVRRYALSAIWIRGLTTLDQDVIRLFSEVAALDSKPGEMPDEAIEVLAELMSVIESRKLKGLAPAIIGAARSNKHGHRDLYLEGLSELGSELAVPEFSQLLRDRAAGKVEIEWNTNPYFLASGLANAGPAGFAALRELFEAKVIDASELSAVLGRFEGSAAIRELERWTRDPDDSVRLEATRCLAAKSDRASAPALAAMLADGRAEIRWQAARGLALLKDPRGLAGMLASSGEASRDRDYEAEALSGYGEAAVGPCVVALGSKNRNEREVALIALQRLASVESLPAVTNALRDSDPRLVELAAKALAAIGEKSSIPALLEALGQGDSDSKIAVYAAIKTLEAKPEK